MKPHEYEQALFEYDEDWNVSTTTIADKEDKRMPKKPISNDKSLIEIFGTVKSETQMAIRVDFGTETIWLPKSQIEDYPDVGESGEILMREWLAEDKGLI